MPKKTNSKKPKAMWEILEEDDFGTTTPQKGKEKKGSSLELLEKNIDQQIEDILENCYTTGEAFTELDAQDFKVDLFFLKPASGNVAQRMFIAEGEIVVDGNYNYGIRLDLPKKMSGQIFYLTREISKNTKPLLAHLWGEEYKVTVILKKSGSEFSVVSLSVYPDGSGKKFPSDSKLYEEMLRKAIPHNTSRHVFSESEADEYVNIMRSVLPKWVLESYEKNKRIKENGATLDEARHARTALVYLTNIDWENHFPPLPDSAQIQRTLDSAFYGLDPVKYTIRRIVAQIRRSNRIPKYGILLHGEAGTGKTTIAKAIADLLDMPSCLLDIPSLGNDSEEFCGSSRIYLNAQPGIILKKMYDFKTSNICLVLNEIDKPAAQGSFNNILLSILDRSGYYDNFLQDTIPTDNFLCIATCNNLETISKPLRDRFIIIDIPSYTESDKQIIFRDFVLPKAIQASDIPKEYLTLSEESIKLVVNSYAAQAGVRDLERIAEQLAGDYCKLTEDDPTLTKITYTPSMIQKILGRPQNSTVIQQISLEPGVVYSACTRSNTFRFFALQVEVFPGSGKLEILGPVPDIQKEYIRVAYLAFKKQASVDLTNLDVSAFISSVLPNGQENHVGLAFYIALATKLLNITLPCDETLFIGGVDLNGSVYLDSSDITSVLRSSEQQSIKAIFGTVGLCDLIEKSEYKSKELSVIEAMNAKNLLELAVLYSKKTKDS